MLQLISMAFAMGILGSFHCMGMCGPLALSLPVSNTDKTSKFLGALVYNAGRVITYAVFGLVFGLIGKSVAMFGFQQWLSISMGVLIIIVFVLPNYFPSVFKPVHLNIGFLEKIRNQLGRLFKEKKSSSLFAIGLLNGLLPCGLVYMASAAAIATGDIRYSILFMVFFGLGTVPVMWSIAFFGNYVGTGLRLKIRKAYPYMIMLMACLLILRGMGLGIRYVSPTVDYEKQTVQKCCPKPM